jgi:hypothetical protein
VQRATPQRARFFLQRHERESALREGLKCVQPGLECHIILFEQQTRSRGAPNRVALRRFRPKRQHPLPNSVPEKMVLCIAGILAPNDTGLA